MIFDRIEGDGENQMKTKLASTLFVALLAAVPLFAHDLFLKLDNYFVKVNDKVKISILNGSFMASEGALSFSRLADVSVVAPDGTRTHPVEADFTKNETTTFLNITPNAAGTYVVGLATMKREIELAGKDFNEYLAEDGIPDMLAERRTRKELDKKANERYSKYVKIIFQAGDARTDNFKTLLGYAVELVPQQHPYNLKAGDAIDVLCLKNGKPLANQFVMSGRESGGKVIAAANVRSNKKGIARIRLAKAGKWYVKFINMARMNGPKLDYESKWASLTFEIK